MSRTRIVWIDIARFLGLLLVIHGHWLETLFKNGITNVFLELKFIHSFHIPLFFILSGYLYHDKRESFSAFWKRSFLTRIVPAFFFNSLGLLVMILIQLSHQPNDLQIKYHLFRSLQILQGLTYYSHISWFLVCLFTVENIHFLLRQKMSSERYVLGFIIVFYILGWFVNNRLELVTSITGFSANFWRIDEAIVAYPFYLIGITLAYKNRLNILLNYRFNYLFLVLTLSITLLTFNLNKAPFIDDLKIVSMATHNHGSFLLFPLTALSGFLTVCLIARLIPGFPGLCYLGQNTIILLGINGLFDNFFNALFFDYFSQNYPILFEFPLEGLKIGMLIFSVLVTVPCIILLNQWLPQLVGKPSYNGPWLKNWL